MNRGHCGNLDGLGRARCLDQARAADLNDGKAGRGERYDEIGFRRPARRSRLASYRLDLATYEIGQRRDHNQRGILRRRDLGRRGVRCGRDELRVVAGPGVQPLHLLVADMVAVGVGQENDVDPAEARILRARHRLSSVVKDAHAGRIFEDRRPVSTAKLAGMRAQRRDLDVLCPGRRPRGQCQHTNRTNDMASHHCLLTLTVSLLTPRLVFFPG